MISRGNVKEVVQSGVCTGCGTCVAICPRGAMRMKETPMGVTYAHIHSDLCNLCGLCLNSCSISCQRPDLFTAEDDPFKGRVLAAFCGYAVDSDIRTSGQSGGVVTAILAYLLESGQVNKALVTGMPEDGTLRARPFFAGCKSELLTAQGSKYSPVSLNAQIPTKAQGNKDKVAIVGLPCHVHGIRNTQKIHTHLDSAVALTIGLFCDRTLAFSAMDFLIGRGKIPVSDVETFQFRDKSRIGWPGEVCFRTKYGKEVRLSSRERIRIKDFFTPLCCRLCFDKLNILSDIAIGDAWGMKASTKGLSVILVRSETGLTLVKEAQKANFINLEEISKDIIFGGQNIEKARFSWLVYSSIFHKITSQFLENRPDEKELFLSKNNMKIFYKNLKRSFSLRDCIDVEKFFRQIRMMLFMARLKNSILLVRYTLKKLITR